ncbi:hypothetical protein MRS44_016043 [Fusarium solani]|uniref:uncharacterized protein n=1 Tax=Fusarium solani TaxID=169388 RepID=UPI0032C3F6B6|nr:hypothetical protein MRS44_016043 [Fusarium solani]
MKNPSQSTTLHSAGVAVDAVAALYPAEVIKPSSPEFIETLGGISYLSAQYGWGIDNLVSVDLVLANGDLVTADKSSHPDLFKALHGGGAHNFGIATSLTLKLYPYQGMWGGMNVVAGKHADAVFDEYDLFTRELVKDGKAHMIMDFTWQGDQIIAIQFMGYPEPKDNPAIYDGSLASEMADMTDTQGKRNAYWTLAMEYNINLLKSIYELWAQTTRPYATRFQLAMDVNHITPAMRNKAAREGVGNLYGLEGPEFPLTNILLTNIWEDEADGEEAMALLRKLGANFEALAKQRGKAIPFKYMNYAHQDQDVIQGFGQQNASFLKRRRP